mmetsp:Transcript_13895/g.16131  ORF Transcript_13895/g.16131 Transcript_13895/m.16131 type:complete len:362 (+) Transcript_13895:321-1406(+)
MRLSSFATMSNSASGRTSGQMQRSFCNYIRSQGRHPCHVYLDYAFCYVISSIIPLIIQLQIPNNNQKYSDLFSRPMLVVFAMVGGSLLSFANIAMQWSTSVFHAPLTTVVALQSSLCVVLGTSTNYFLQPDKTDRPDLLRNGVISFLVAILSASRAQTWYQHLKQQPQQQQQQQQEIILNDNINDNFVDNYVDSTTENMNLNMKTMKSNISLRKEQQYTNINIWEVETSAGDINMKRTKEKEVWLGIAVASIGGIFIGFFTPAFNIAVNDIFNWYDDGGLPLACANLWFSLAFVTFSITSNHFLMSSTTLTSIPLTSWRSYMNESFHERKLALTAGFLCALGNFLQFEGGYMAGFAAADMV